MESNLPIGYHRLNELFSEFKEIIIPFLRGLVLKVHDLKVSVKNNVHAFDDVNEIYVFLYFVTDQAGHVEETKILQFSEVDIFDVIIKVRRENLESFHGYVASENHFPEISEYLGF